MDQQGAQRETRKAVLIAEDNEGVRALVALVMAKRGWTTLEAADGHEAAHLIDREYQTIDLLISDIVMPRVGGLELAVKALSRRSRLPVVLMSVTNRRDLPPGSIGNGIVFLQKPFTAMDLASAAEAALRVVEDALPERPEEL